MFAETLLELPQGSRPRMRVQLAQVLCQRFFIFPLISRGIEACVLELIRQILDIRPYGRHAIIIAVFFVQRCRRVFQIIRHLACLGAGCLSGGVDGALRGSGFGGQREVDDGHAQRDAGFRHADAPRRVDGLDRPGDSGRIAQADILISDDQQTALQ